MRKHWNGFVPASILIVGLAAASALYAQDEPATRQTPMDHRGMMQEGRGMMNMMNMMGQMGEMMEACNTMMQDHMTKRDRPNEQWQDREQRPQEDKE